MFWQNKTTTFFDYFVEHAQTICEAAVLLEELFMDSTSSHQVAKKIKEKEHKADLITHAVIMKINSSNFILPIDREDIFSLTKTLDDVIDIINSSSEAYAEIYQLEKATQYAERLSKTITAATQLLLEICKLLNKPARNNEKIRQLCIEVHRLENIGDDIKREALRTLFAQIKLKEIEFPYYIAWKEIYQTLEFVTDKAEDCANITEQIVMKYS